MKLPKWDVGLIEAALVVNALLLPVREALTVTAAGWPSRMPRNGHRLQKAISTWALTHGCQRSTPDLVVRTIGGDSRSFEKASWCHPCLLGTAWSSRRQPGPLGPGPWRPCEGYALS